MSADAAEIKALLQANVEALAAELVPDGRRNGNYWIGRNPTRDDRHGGSFWVSINRFPGAWKDEATGDTGDVFQLIGYCVGLTSFSEILKWARGHLGLGDLSDDERRRRVAVARESRASEADEAERLEAERKRAFAMYVRAKKLPFAGSPADLYLQSRGIDVRRLGRMPGVLGWLDRWQRRDGTSTDVTMLAGLQDASGRTVAVHRTFLVDDGRGGWMKKPGEARKIWPSYGGTSIRLWRGESRLSIEDAAKCGLRETLVLVEGVEDGLSVALAMPQMRIWCTASLPNLALQVLPECCDEVIVCADNDWGKRQAQKQFDAAIARLVAQGRTVRIARSPIGKDMNDALRGAG